MLWRRALALVAVGAVATVGLAAPASADSAPANPDNPATPVTVALDSLPTVQISGGTYNNRAGGVVWTQAVVGDTVYVGGDFTRVRPAGAARGTGEVTRTYLLAYDVRTGELLPFNHTLDGEVLSMAVSPDGQRLYVGGAFAHVDGKWRVNIAAFSTADGSLVETFQPVASTKVLSIAASDSAVYIGGNFLKVGPKSGATLLDRKHLAGFSAADGSVLPFRADADEAVTALALTPDGSRLVVGGRYLRLSNQAVPGLGSVDPTSGAVQSFPTNQYIKTLPGGSGGTITGLVAEGDSVYGSAYQHGGTLTSEGVFRSDARTGQLIWHADCHGDTYSVFPMGDAVYQASHAHWCGAIGGFPDTRNQVPDYYRAVAFSKAATGKVSSLIQAGYDHMKHQGEPSPSLLNWYPQFPAGTYTGLKQGPWHVTGNGTYLVYGGEFTQVNGVGQEGLARFAMPSVAPNAHGPKLSGTKWATPTVRSLQAGRVTATIVANYDYDNSDLTYRLYRNTEVGGPVAETKVSSSWWSRGTVTLTDTQAPSGTTQKYWVTAVDPFGNVAKSPEVSVTVSGQVQQLKPGDSLATDAFERSATGGWGRATLGGGWQHDSKP
ncbi:MAG: cell surface protein, partial [Micrococcales bacterium]|nr:cell surface protein [Micrococcales bacterium]